MPVVTLLLPNGLSSAALLPPIPVARAGAACANTATNIAANRIAAANAALRTGVLLAVVAFKSHLCFLLEVCVTKRSNLLVKGRLSMDLRVSFLPNLCTKGRIFITWVMLYVQIYVKN